MTRHGHVHDASGGQRSTSQKRDDKGRIRHGGEWLALWADPTSMMNAAERAEAQRADRAQEALHNRIQAAGRALSRRGIQTGKQDESGGFGRFGDDLQDPLRFAAARGEANMEAAYERFSDAPLRRSQVPEGPEAQALFLRLEKIRTAVLAAGRWPGIRQTLLAAQVERLQRSDLMGAVLASMIPVAEGVEMAVRDRLLGEVTPSIDCGGLRLWDRWLTEHAEDLLAAMADSVEDQRAFGTLTAALFDRVRASGVVLEQVRDPLRQRKSEPSGDDTGRDPGRRGADEEGAEGQPGERAKANLEGSRYTIFSRDHDRIVSAETLAEPQTMTLALEKLLEKRGDQAKQFRQLGIRLIRHLQALQRRDWRFDEEEGELDPSRLARVVARPGFDRAYRRERTGTMLDTAVTLLIDNSGSMRGRSIELACLAADMVAGALDRVNVPCEILGFTTGDWKGGAVVRAWRDAGAPSDPGRLNGLLHIIYKGADEPYRRARKRLAAMLLPGLLKENIDGEALEWAEARLLKRRETRRILIVLSDGSPADQATLTNNSDGTLFERHLRTVIDRIEGQGRIELSALGIRHDVGSLYRNAATLKTADALGVTLIDALQALLSR